MDMTTTSSFVLQASMQAVVANRLPPSRPRRITPQAGRALEILGHAIEYLADEFVHHGGQMYASQGRLEAMRLLMERNREIYAECPEIPTFGERCTAVLTRLWN
jgi:hypothetical protein